MQICCPLCGQEGKYIKGYVCDRCGLKIKISIPEGEKIKIELAKKVTIIIEE